MKTMFYLGSLVTAMLSLAACKDPLQPTTIDIQSPTEPDTVKSTVTATVNGKPWKFVTPDTVSIGAYDNNGNLYRRDEPLLTGVLAKYDKVFDTPFSLGGGGFKCALS